VNRHLFTGLRSFEAHYAIYPAGTRYARHLDQFQGDRNRSISCVFYLNERWTDEDGGQLRLYLPSSGGGAENECVVQLLPVAGTLVCFRSDRVPHEVLPSLRERRSVAGWFRTDAPGIPDLP